MENTDSQILRALRRGVDSIDEISKEIDIDKNTVMQRIEWLTKNGFVFHDNNSIKIFRQKTIDLSFITNWYSL